MATTSTAPRQPPTTSSSSPTSSSKRNPFRRMIDPLPMSFSRRDTAGLDSEQGVERETGEEVEPVKPRRSLSFPSSGSREREKEGGEGMYNGRGIYGDEDGVGVSTADAVATSAPVSGDLVNGHTTNGGSTLSRDGYKGASGKSQGLEDGTTSTEGSSSIKGAKGYVNGSKELPTIMQGEDATGRDENLPRYGSGGTMFQKFDFDRNRQLPTPVLSPGGPVYSGQRRSSVAGPVTGLGVALGNRQTPPSEVGPSTSTGDSFGTGREARDKLPGRNDRSRDVSPRQDQRKIRVRKLSSAKMHELTSSPESTVLRTVPSDADNARKMSLSSIPLFSLRDEDGPEYSEACVDGSEIGSEDGRPSTRKVSVSKASKNIVLDDVPEIPGLDNSSSGISSPREKQQPASRTVSSTDASTRRRRSSVGSKSELPSQSSTFRSRSGRAPKRIDLDPSKGGHFGTPQPDPHPSPMPQSIPLPPLSVPTYLQLELSSNRPSPLYIHKSATNDFPYESSRVKIERLQNFLLLPPQLEQVLWFGALACLDAWLYSFTILPLRFFKAIFILFQSWAINIGVEIQFVWGFVFEGVRRVWRRRRQRRDSTLAPVESKDVSEGASRERSTSVNTVSSKRDASQVDRESRNRSTSGQHDSRRHHGASSRKHRRTKSIPSALVPDDKADILKGLLMIVTCTILMYFDASRMYHWIRGQAAIKLYVIYNVLEVADRLFSAIGQDVLECLFSREALERKPDGRSKVMRPFWLFIIALAYTVIHSTSLFYQVITLNVAVNSYSNALITLLLSNQFVEIKSTVFKKFDKENLFQLTCADVVERFQLWLMLTIIASRNIVETGGFSFGSTLSSTLSSTIASASTNSTPASTPPRSYSSILPKSFTLFPSSVFASLSDVNSILPSIGQVLGPFLVVLGSEMLVDWLKHAYINKFNNTRPAIYGRFLDVLAKDYYTNAFGDQNLTRRLGLPVIPLSCLFFRVSVQTYQMFLAAWLPQLPSTSTSASTTSLSSIHEQYSASPPYPSASSLPFIETITSAFPTSINQFTTFLSQITPPPPTISLPIFTILLLLLTYLTLLLFKLALGIALLSFSRARYKRMKTREREHFPFSNGNPPTTTKQSEPQHQQSQPAPSPSLLPSPTTPRPTSQASTNPTTTAHPPQPESHTVEGGRRVGGWGVVEVDDSKRRWIYLDDPEGLKQLKDREARNNAKDRKVSSSTGKDLGIEGVMRYEMVAKRIW
ncbi:hypothetical protein FQN54_001624 [Arachnomyces sp. PD_36]|nr:hypothetical protein FQN54_001624 [Arachnomyces sp. PD_36]